MHHTLSIYLMNLKSKRYIILEIPCKKIKILNLYSSYCPSGQSCTETSRRSITICPIDPTAKCLTVLFTILPHRHHRVQFVFFLLCMQHAPTWTSCSYFKDHFQFPLSTSGELAIKKTTAYETFKSCELTIRADVCFCEYYQVFFLLVTSWCLLMKGSWCSTEILTDKNKY